MTFDLFCKHFKVGDTLTISGGPALTVAIISHEEQIVVLKRWKRGRIPHWDYELFTSGDLETFMNQIRKL